jgi:hypothetical protein
LDRKNQVLAIPVPSSIGGLLAAFSLAGPAQNPLDGNNEQKRHKRQWRNE